MSVEGQLQCGGTVLLLLVLLWFVEIAVAEFRWAVRWPYWAESCDGYEGCDGCCTPLPVQHSVRAKGGTGETVSAECVKVALALLSDLCCAASSPPPHTNTEAAAATASSTTMNDRCTGRCERPYLSVSPSSPSQSPAANLTPAVLSADKDKRQWQQE